MIQVRISGNYFPERRYAVHCLLTEFLGLSLIWQDSDDRDICLVLANGKSLIIKDHFFCRQKPYPGYLSVENIPSPVSLPQIEGDILPLFGTTQILRTPEGIIWDADIVSSTFFMLSRWEEQVNLARDRHCRFPLHEALSMKAGFYERPIVNEYVEKLWEMLLELGINRGRKKRSFDVVFTHDVDVLRLFRSPVPTVRTCLSQPQLLLKSLPMLWGNRRDPFDTFDYLMDLSESVGLQSRFYFMAGGKTRYDGYYDVESHACRNIISNILRRGHCIGLHPSYDSYNQPQMIAAEKQMLEQVAKVEITEGRQHFLRFSVSDTWAAWESANLKVDSTLCYADAPGFRAGICFEYPVFDIQNRCQLRLRERPLIVMEGSLVHYEKLSVEAAQEKILRLAEIVKRFSGDFVLLWHNSSFGVSPWSQYEVALPKVLKATVQQ